MDVYYQSMFILTTLNMMASILVNYETLNDASDINPDNYLENKSIFY